MMYPFPSPQPLPQNTQALTSEPAKPATASSQVIIKDVEDTGKFGRKITVTGKHLDTITEVFVEHNGNRYTADLEASIEKSSEKMILKFKPIKPAGDASIKFKWEGGETEKDFRVKGLKG